MKIIITVISIVLTTISFSCSRSNPGVNDTKEEEARLLAVQRTEIEKMAIPVSCTDPGDWKFIPVGSKPCGGPAGYIAYHSSVDENGFKAKVEAYTEAQSKFNKKWKLVSDCSMELPPSGVICQNEKPVLIYNNSIK